LARDTAEHHDGPLEDLLALQQFGVRLLKGSRVLVDFLHHHISSDRVPVYQVPPGFPAPLLSELLVRHIHLTCPQRICASLKLAQTVLLPHHMWRSQLLVEITSSAGPDGHSQPASCRRKTRWGRSAPRRPGDPGRDGCHRL
jgi:hypothetical protein